MRAGSDICQAGGGRIRCVCDSATVRNRKVDDVPGRRFKPNRNLTPFLAVGQPNIAITLPLSYATHRLSRFINMTDKPLTLGEILAPHQRETRQHRHIRLRKLGLTMLNLALILAIFVVASWWLLTQPDIPDMYVGAVLLVLGIAWLLVASRQVADARQKSHFLLANDHQGFMRDLRLDARTVIFDGSNIYHFGRNNGLDAQPLGELADRLRREGYRVVCFFDANIFFTLAEHGAFTRETGHSPALLGEIFGLNTDEIYVVPGGVQADKYILECLKHLPISFAVTNDRYRDYAKAYPSVMKDPQWRKGVTVSKSGVRLQ